MPGVRRRRSWSTAVHKAIAGEIDRAPATIQPYVSSWMSLPQESYRPSPASRRFSPGRAISTFAWLLGLALTAYLVRRIGTATIGHAFQRVGARFFWVVAAYAAATAAGAIPWALLL